LLSVLIVLHSAAFWIISPAAAEEQGTGQLPNAEARVDTDRPAVVNERPADPAGRKGPDAASQGLRYLNCLCKHCGTLGGAFTRDATDECDGSCTCEGPCSSFCTPVPVAERFVTQCYGSVYEVKEPTPDQVQRGLDLARAENRRTLEAALTRQLGANKLDVAVVAAESALKHDPGLQSPMLAEVGGQAKVAGWEALDKGNHALAIKRLEQATRLLPADEEVRAKLEQTKVSAAQGAAPK
jgi:hypothetical protein